MSKVASPTDLEVPAVGFGNAQTDDFPGVAKTHGGAASRSPSHTRPAAKWWRASRAKRFGRGNRHHGEPVSISRQFFEQTLCLSQIGRREALGEPVINWCQKLARLFAPNLVAPPSGKTRRGAQFP